MSGRGSAGHQKHSTGSSDKDGKKQKHQQHNPAPTTTTTISTAKAPQFPSAPDASTSSLSHANNNNNNNRRSVTPGHNYMSSPIGGIPVSPSSFFPGPGSSSNAQLPRSLKVLADVARGTTAFGPSSAGTTTTTTGSTHTPTTSTPVTPSRTRNAVLGAFWSEVNHLTTQFGGGIVSSSGAGALGAVSSSRNVTPARPVVANPVAVAASPRGLASAKGRLGTASGSLDSLMNNNAESTGSNKSDSSTTARTPTAPNVHVRNSESGSNALRNKFFDAFKQLCDSASIVVHDLSSASVQRAAKTQQQQQQQQLGVSPSASSKTKKSTQTDSPTATLGSSGADNSGEITLNDLLYDLSEYVGVCCGVPKESLARQVALSGAAGGGGVSQSTDRASSVASAFQKQQQHHHHVSSAASVITGGGGAASTIAGGVGTRSTIGGQSDATTTNNNNSNSNRAVLANPRDRRRQREEVSASANLVLLRGHQNAAMMMTMPGGGSSNASSASLASGGKTSTHSGLDNALFEALGGPIQQHGIDIPLEKQNVFMPWTLPEPYPKSMIVERVPVGRFNTSKFGQQVNLAGQPPQRESSGQQQQQQGQQQGGGGGLGYSTVLDICAQADKPDVFSKWVARNRALRVPTADGGDAALTFLRAANLTSASQVKSPPPPPTTTITTTTKTTAAAAGNNSSSGSSAAAAAASAQHQQPAAITFPHSGDATILNSGGGTSSATTADASGTAAVASSVQIPREWLAGFVHHGVWVTSESKDTHGNKTPAWKPALPSSRKGSVSPRLDAVSTPQEIAMTPLTL